MKKLGKRNRPMLASIEAYNACSSYCTFPSCSCGIFSNYTDNADMEYYKNAVAVYSVKSGGK